ncbi:MAG TPA: hypothetical protein VGC14_05085 [Rhizobium sp.]
MPELADQNSPSHELVLAPGDKAPPLRLSIGFDGHTIGDIQDVRNCVILLWNAGCASCLPTAEEIAQAAETSGFQSINVAVMVRDFRTTATAAYSSSAKSLFGLEGRDVSDPSSYRGSVTRNWLEASGQTMIPAAFVVDRNGIVVWMGLAEAALVENVLIGISDDTWNVHSFRKEWLSHTNRDDVLQNRTNKNLTEFIFAGDTTSAIKLINRSEMLDPIMTSNKEFNFLKLVALASHSESHDAAFEHYRQCSQRFPNDVDLKVRLGRWILAKVPDQDVYEAVSATLMAVIRDRGEASEPLDVWLDFQMRLVITEALFLSGETIEAHKWLQKIASAVRAESHPEDVRVFVNGELDRLSALAGSDKNLRPD